MDGRKHKSDNGKSEQPPITDSAISTGGGTDNPDATHEPSGTDTTVIRQFTEFDSGTQTQTGNETPTETKRGRGRPRKNPESGQTTFSVHTQKVGKSSKRPTGEDRKLYTPDEAKQVTGVILGIVEALAVSTIGEKAQFNNLERTLLESSLPPMLERMSVSAAEKTAQIMYPAMLGFASVSYAIRLVRLRSEGQQVPYEPVPEPSLNGHVEQDETANPINPDTYKNYRDFRN